MEKQIQKFQNINKTQKNIPHNTKQGAFNKLEDHRSNNTTKFKTNPNLFIYNDNSKELEEYRNSSDYEQMWEIAIDKWTRNWNFYRERLTDSIMEKFQLNNKSKNAKQRKIMSNYQDKI